MDVKEMVRGTPLEDSKTELLAERLQKELSEEAKKSQTVAATRAAAESKVGESRISVAVAASATEESATEATKPKGKKRSEQRDTRKEAAGLAGVSEWKARQAQGLVQQAPELAVNQRGAEHTARPLACFVL